MTAHAIPTRTRTDPFSRQASGEDHAGVADGVARPKAGLDGRVTVSDDGHGNALLTFPGGESLTLVGIAPDDVTDADMRAALGLLDPDDLSECAGNAPLDDLFVLDDTKDEPTTGIASGDTAYAAPRAGTGGGGLSGSFAMADGTHVPFTEIENIICFTPGTRILTGLGERPIETLRIGDLVVTRDQGLRPIRWIGRRTVPGLGGYAPVRVGLTAQDTARGGLLVSQQHRILVTGYDAQRLFGQPEILVAARHLVDGRDARLEPCAQVTYVHLMFDRHEVIYADGLAAESFHGGDVGLNALTGPAREELFAVYPELRGAPGGHLETVRKCLDRLEARRLLEARSPVEAYA